MNPYEYLIIAFIALAIFWLVTIAIAEVIIGVLFAREYYRQNPEKVPPDKFLVRLGLWRVR